MEQQHAGLRDTSTEYQGSDDLLYPNIGPRSKHLYQPPYAPRVTISFDRGQKAESQPTCWALLRP